MYIVSHGWSMRDNTYKKQACRDGWEKKIGIYIFVHRQRDSSYKEQYLEMEGREKKKNTGIAAVVVLRLVDSLGNFS